MEFVIRNHIIDATIPEILYTIKKDCDKPLFKVIQDKGDYIRTNCPTHKGGTESHPSFSIYNRDDNPDIPFGTTHCFTCGYSSTLTRMIGECFDKDTTYGEEWLIKHFGDAIVEEIVDEVKIPDSFNWDCDLDNESTSYLDESILQKYNFYHPYMKKRKLSDEVIKKFNIGYDKDLEAITFPVYDEFNHLVMITERCVNSKKFYIPHDIEKPVYLLNTILNENIHEVIVCEGQIDALVAWSYGVPAVALFGAGTTKSQLAKLKDSGIIHYILMYDNDLAGRSGAEKFKKYLDDEAFITDIIMPNNKDVADCSKEELFNILKTNNVDIKKYF